VGILRLAHVDVRTPDLELSTAYYTEVLGLQLAERGEDTVYLKCWDEEDHHSIRLRYDPRIGLDLFSFRVEHEDDLAHQLGVWLERSHSPHDIAIVNGPNGALHHFAFWLDDWDQVCKAADILAFNGVQIDQGPTRHGITRGNTIYFFDPLGNRNEVLTGGYRPTPTAAGPRRPPPHRPYRCPLLPGPIFRTEVPASGQPGCNDRGTGRRPAALPAPVQGTRRERTGPGGRQRPARGGR
jgi:catechol 2,3-dioxygenase-like lactoylglutathione lyase family enzyme